MFKQKNWCKFQPCNSPSEFQIFQTKLYVQPLSSLLCQTLQPELLDDLEAMQDVSLQLFSLTDDKNELVGDNNFKVLLLVSKNHLVEAFPNHQPPTFLGPKISAQHLQSVHKSCPKTPKVNLRNKLTKGCKLIVFISYLKILTSRLEDTPLKLAVVN